MGDSRSASATFGPGVETGPVKIIVTDHELPAVDSLISWISACHDAGRPVAVHCVTAVALALSLAAWDEAAVLEGDRIEHGSMITEQAVGRLGELGLIVVTQPHFLAERGDTYLDEVDASEKDDLYRCGSLLRAGVRVAVGTDSPYGDLDPWSCVRAAVERRTPGGQVLGADERVTPRQALDLLLSPLSDPGGAPRRVRIGAPADLVLLRSPLDAVLSDPRCGRRGRDDDRRAGGLRAVGLTPRRSGSSSPDKPRRGDHGAAIASGHRFSCEIHPEEAGGHEHDPDVGQTAKHQGRTTHFHELAHDDPDLDQREADRTHGHHRARGWELR